MKNFSKKVEFRMEKLIFGINLGANRKKKLLNGEKRGNESSFSLNRGNGINSDKFQTAPLYRKWSADDGQAAAGYSAEALAFVHGQDCQGCQRG
ncbi:MAG: hypothetical protein J5654_00635 [Victivallales bacterium]|nr:hypothetical protein [Victivallales bacterium]